MFTRRMTALLLILCIAGASLLGLAALYATIAFDPSARPGAREAILVLCVVVGSASLVGAAAMLHQHFRQLERIRGAIVTLTGDPGAGLPKLREGEGNGEVGRLWSALGELSVRQKHVRAKPDERLRSVLTAIAEAIVVITQNGQVSLVNAPAKELLGPERVRVGTSVFAALHRHPLWEAMRRAEIAGGLIEAELLTVEDAHLRARVATLDGHAGAVLTFLDSEAVARRHDVEHALDLHDHPPDGNGLNENTPLDDLAMTVVDVETTGLDVREARIVSIGAVRMHGGRIYRGAVLDRLVRPDVSIPWRSTAIHGITDPMVADAPTLAEVFAELRRFIEATVLVGHNIAFDVAILERECRRHDLEWSAPPVLDTLLLAGALWPDSPDLSLEGLAMELGVEVHGRHTALGDCLLTGQVLQRMLPQLQDRGVATLAAVQAFARRRKDLVKMQRASGWYD